MEISYSENIRTNEVVASTLDSVIDKIQTDESLEKKVSDLRDLTVEDNRRQIKATLPYFILGAFRDNIRRIENFVLASGLILDCDHLNDDELSSLAASLRNDPEVLFFFRSPGGHGMKVGIPFEEPVTDPDEYQKVYKTYATLFSAKYNVPVDLQASDCTRACFMSYDPDMYRSESNVPINTAHLAQICEAIEGSPDTGKDLTGLANVIDFLIVKNNDTHQIYNDYRSWQILGLSLASLGEQGREYFLKLSKNNTRYADNDEDLKKEFDKLLKYYDKNRRSPVTIGTVFFIAQQNGYGDSEADLAPETSSQVQPPTLQDLLAAIAALPTETEKQLALRKLSKELKVPLKALMEDLKSLPQAQAVLHEKIAICHPSYDVQEDFLILGFRETVIVNQKPEDRNIFFISDHKGQFFTTHEESFRIEDKLVVIDMRDRELVNLSDRWSRDSLNAFLSSPEAPVGTYLRLKNAIKEFIEFQNEAHYGMVAAWIITTYFHRCFFGVPYLFFFGKKQCAKSRALELLERFSFNAIKVKGSSLPSFIDTVDGLRGAFLTDQAEFLSDPKNQEIVGYHADSYTIGGGNRRIVTIVSGIRKVLSFSSYGPKAYAAIKEIDPDLKDRCVEVPMVRASKEYNYPEAQLPLWADLRNDLYHLLLTRWKDAKEIYKTAGKEVSQRIRELWRPLETVLKLENVPEDEIQSIFNAFQHSMKMTQDQLSGKELILFEALQELTKAKKSTGESLSSTDIGTKMKEIATKDQFDLGFDRDKGLATWIGTTIKKFGLFSEFGVRKNKRMTYKFHSHHIEDIRKRYEGSHQAEAKQPVTANAQIDPVKR